MTNEPMEQLELSPLATKTRRRSRLVPATPDTELRMTPARLRILQLIQRYPYSTGQMIALAYADGGSVGAKFIQHELGELHHCAYVRRHYSPARPAGDGSETYLYTITTKGGRGALAPDEFDEQRTVILNRMAAKRNYEHFTGLSTLRLILELGPLDDESRTVPAQGWQLVDFRNDHEHQDSRIRVQVGGQLVTLWPDAEAVLHHDDRDGHSLWLFEFDRERKSNPRIDLRFRAYLRHLSEPSLTRLRAQHHVNGAVAVFIAPDEQQQHRLVLRARDIIAEERPQPRPLFLFWNAEHWYEQRLRERRQNVGTPQERTRTWVQRSLRDPRVILSEDSVLAVTGKSRRLVQFAGGES